MIRAFWPAIIGVAGTLVLISLCTWQLQRLEWKEGIIAQLEARLAAVPVAVPAIPAEDAHQFLRVEAAGRLGPEELHVLTTRKPRGAGFLIIAPMTLTDGRRILVELGYVPEADKADSRLKRNVEGLVLGTLLWPGEVDSFTPEPDLGANIWFARDVDAMAEALGTEPVLLVAELHPIGAAPSPRRLGVNIPNNHLNYAITWGLLALAWGGMTTLWVVRRRREV
ncbi:MAG: SURF1 family protein [Pseudomonadota bacterium]